MVIKPFASARVKGAINETAMKTIRILLMATMLMGFVNVMAQSNSTPVVDQRERNQRHRIREGVASGELTRREAAKARHDQRSIRRSERRAKADGTVTKKERVNLQRKENRASRSLRRNKHDDQQRTTTTGTN